MEYAPITRSPRARSRNLSTFEVSRLYTAIGNLFRAMLSARFSPITASPIIPIFASSGLVCAVISFLSISCLFVFEVTQQVCRRFINHPQQSSVQRTDELTLIRLGSKVTFEDLFECFGFVFARDQKRNIARVADCR